MRTEQILKLKRQRKAEPELEIKEELPEGPGVFADLRNHKVENRMTIEAMTQKLKRRTLDPWPSEQATYIRVPTRVHTVQTVRAALPYSAAIDEEDAAKALQVSEQFYPPEPLEPVGGFTVPPPKEQIPERPETRGSQFSGLSELEFGSSAPVKASGLGMTAAALPWSQEEHIDSYLPVVVGKGQQGQGSGYQAPVVWH